MKEYTSHFLPERYERPFFKDRDLQNSIRDQGYCVVDFLSVNELNEIIKGYDQFSKQIEEGFGNQFWPSGRHHRADVRNSAKNEIEKVIPHRLKDFFIKDTFRFIGGTFLIKPPSGESALNPHQDSSHVNELEAFSVYAWIPLQDVNEQNGAMKVLPKSHQINIKQRSLNVPWILEEYTSILEQYMISLPMKAGQLLFFDAAMIHSSPPNFSNNIRVAINYYIHPAEQAFTHFYRDDTMEKGKVELYSVTPEFYYNEDFESKPSSKYKLLGEQKQLINSISESELEKLLQSLNNSTKSKNPKSMGQWLKKSLGL